MTPSKSFSSRSQGTAFLPVHASHRRASVGIGVLAGPAGLAQSGLLFGLALHAADSGVLPVTREQHDDLTADLRTGRAASFSAADRCLDELVALLDATRARDLRHARRGERRARLRPARPSPLRHAASACRRRRNEKRPSRRLVDGGILRGDGGRRRPRRRTALMFLSTEGVNVVFYTSLAPKHVRSSRRGGRPLSQPGHVHAEIGAVARACRVRSA